MRTIFFKVQGFTPAFDYFPHIALSTLYLCRSFPSPKCYFVLFISPIPYLVTLSFVFLLIKLALVPSFSFCSLPPFKFFTFLIVHFLTSFYHPFLFVYIKILIFLGKQFIIDLFSIKILIFTKIIFYSLFLSYIMKESFSIYSIIQLWYNNANSKKYHVVNLSL